MTYEEVKKKFEEITNNLTLLAADEKHANPFVFVCSSVVIEYLANMYYGRDINDKDYYEFIEKRFKKVNTLYFDFEYSDVKRKDLPKQMRYILRNGIVHSYSLFPGKKYKIPIGRPRSIVIVHRSSGSKHLEEVQVDEHSACVFVAEDFTCDIGLVSNEMFSEAEKPGGEDLKKKILKWTTDHPPITWREN